MKIPKFVYFLVLFSFATGFAIYSADLQTQKSAKHHKGGKKGGHMMPMLEMFKFADEMEISNTQLIQLRMLFQKIEKKAELLGIDKKHKKPEFKKPETPEEIKTFVEEISKKMEQRMLLHLELKNELKTILSEDQINKIEKMKKPHFKPFMHGQGHGMGRHMAPPPPPPPPHHPFDFQAPFCGADEDKPESDF